MALKTRLQFVGGVICELMLLSMLTMLAKAVCDLRIICDDFNYEKNNNS